MFCIYCIFPFLLFLAEASVCLCCWRPQTARDAASFLKIASPLGFSSPNLLLPVFIRNLERLKVFLHQGDWGIEMIFVSFYSMWKYFVLNFSKFEVLYKNRKVNWLSPAFNRFPNVWFDQKKLVLLFKWKRYDPWYKDA